MLSENPAVVGKVPTKADVPAVDRRQEKVTNRLRFVNKVLACVIIGVIIAAIIT